MNRLLPTKHALINMVSKNGWFKMASTSSFNNLDKNGPGKQRSDVKNLFQEKRPILGK